jgi:hypothetical protein
MINQCFPGKRRGGLSLVRTVGIVGLVYCEQVRRSLVLRSEKWQQNRT